MSKIKIAIIYNNYGPYHLARLDAIKHLAKSKGWEIFGVQINQVSRSYGWELQKTKEPLNLHTVINNEDSPNLGMLSKLKKLKKILVKLDPDILVISGYGTLMMNGVLWWALAHKKISILMSESKQDDAFRHPLKEKIKSIIMKRFDAALVGGETHKSYLINLGMKKESIALGYDVVDNEVFHPNKIKNLPNPIKHPFFLAINRFIPKKNLILLIEAYAGYQKQKGTAAWHLVLCGDGQMRLQLQQLIVKQGLKDFVHLPGFLQQEELLPYLAHAKCFIHASIQEQWGLVVNEAMAAGLPVIVSDRCGCFKDLVVEENNGFGFNPEKQEELTDLLIRTNSSDIDLKKMGDESLKHIQKYSPKYHAEGLEEAIEYACAKG